MRDAAYALQLPSARARLHLLAMQVLEAITPDDQLSPISSELANHARSARLGMTAGRDLEESELRYMQMAAVHAEQQFNSHDAALWLERVAKHRLLPHDEAAATMVRAGMHHWFSGHADRAETCFNHVINGDEKAHQCLALIERGTLYRDLGRDPEARVDLERAIDLSVEVEDRVLEMRARGNLATVTQTIDSLEKSKQRFYEVIAIARELENDRAVGISLGSLALRHHHSDDTETAKGLFEEAIDILHRVGDMENEATFLSNYASLLHELGDRRAFTFMERAVSLDRKTGNRPRLATSLISLSTIVTTIGDPNYGIELALEGETLASEVGRHHFIGIAQLARAEALFELGRHDEAKALAEPLIGTIDSKRVNKRLQELLAKLNPQP